MNQDGYILSILPLFIFFTSICLSAVLATTSFIQIRNQYQHLCRKQGLMAQKKMKETLKKILALNTKAKILNRAHDSVKLLQLKAYFSLNLPLILKTQSLERKIISTKKAVYQLQKSTLSLGHVLANRELLKVKQNSSEKNQWFKKYFRANYTPARLQLKKTQKKSRDLPIYQPVKNFSQKQKIRIWWRASLNRSWEEIFSLNQHIPSLHGSCSTTLIQRRNQWLPILY